jgi:hypothetical protein
MLEAPHARSLASLVLVSDIDLTGRIIAQQYRGQAGGRLPLANPFSNRRGDFGSNGFRKLLAVKLLCRHSVNLRGGLVEFLYCGTPKVIGAPP